MCHFPQNLQQIIFESNEENCWIVTNTNAILGPHRLWICCLKNGSEAQTLMSHE